MKKKLAFIVLALLVVFAFSSCDLWYAVFGDPIIGTWKLTAGTVNGTAFTIGPSGYDMTMTIAKDNTLTISAIVSGTPYTETGTWSRSDTTYTLLVPSQPTGGVTITATGTLSSDNKTLNLTLVPGPLVTSVSETWTRQ